MSKPKGERYTVAVDFDGVIHSYTSPWAGADVIPDPPVPGAIEWLLEISKKFTVVLFTTRGETNAGQYAVRAWLDKHGWPSGRAWPDVTNSKPHALVYIDDRAWRFEGRFPTAHEIHGMRPWNKPQLDLQIVHGWFELSYAQYLTVPRSVLEAMPQEWQARFVHCL
jgi:hypothetical protein